MWYPSERSKPMSGASAATEILAMPKRAYSYSRISTKGKQAKGRGLDRQDEFYQELAPAEGGCLDDSLVFSDRGKSGFHGDNLKATPDLARFLDLVKRGRI